MKKFLLIVPVVIIATGLFYYYNKTGSSAPGVIIDKPVEKEAYEINEQEELEARARHEFIMTVDPALGYVPIERLPVAEKRAGEIMASLGSTSSFASAVSWVERGPNNIGGRTRGFIFDQNDATGNTALSGGVSGGLWRTTNFKSATPTWTQISSISQNLAITCIAQDPQTFNTMYAGTGEGYNNLGAVRGLGVYKSIDAGLTWTLLTSTTTGGTNANDFSFVQKILVYNNAAHDVYVACRSAVFCNSGGLMRSTNGGTSWSRVLGTYTGCGNCTCATDFKIFDIEKSLSGDLWVSSVTESSGAGKIWKSPAGATVGNSGTWVDKTPTGSWQRIELACSPTNNNRVYAVMQGSGSAVGGMRRTDDGAAVPASSWTDITSTTLWCDQGTSSSADFSRNQAWYDLMIAVKPDDDNTVFAGGVDIMKTTSAGTPASSWSQITQWASGCAALPNVHADIHNLIYLPGSTTEFVVACDGGLFYTANGGTTFSDKNAGYNVTQYYSCAIHPSAGSNVMLGGSQDNGSHKFSTAGINSVTYASGGDGGFCFIDQKNPLQQITNYTGTTLNVSNDGGGNFNTNLTVSFTTDRFINPADYDTASSTSPALSTAARYYCGGAVRNLRRVTVNFSALSVSSNSFTATPTTTNHSVSAVKVDPNTTTAPNRVWVAYSTADAAAASVVPQLYYATNANATPTFNQVTLPAAVTSGQYISSIDVENGDPNHILITISNYGVASVYESVDLGANWTSLDNNGVNLPDVPVRWGMFLPSGYNQATNAVGGIMLATELGVWGTNTISGNTTPFVQNASIMGNVRVEMLKLRGSDKTVVAATHGRGLFTAQLNLVLPVEFISFKGMPLDNSNRLVWKVAELGNNAGFDVERKYPGESQFVKFDFVPAKPGSVGEVEYIYDDKMVNLTKEHAIYRLKQIDKNGSYKYSDQAIVKRSLAGKMVLFVTAANNILTIRTGYRPDIRNVNVTIVDQQGRVVQSMSQKFQDMAIDISRLASGVYYVRMQSNNTGEMITTKFVK